MKKLTLLLPFLFSTFFLFSQSMPYDISQYKARFDKWTGLGIVPGFSYLGEYGQQYYRELTALSLGGNFYWFHFLNQDQKIVNFIATGGMSGGLNNRVFFNGQSIEYDDFSLELNLSREAIHYFNTNSFFGWEGRFRHRFRLNSEFLIARDLSLEPGLSVFQGWGRLEFAQDAILANWIMSELETQGVLADDYLPSDVEVLARGITELSRDRTFDLRRRRIYQIKALIERLKAAGIVNEERFELFATLNDNFNFAFRTSIANGERFTYGLTTDWNYDNRLFQQTRGTVETTSANVGGFLGYEHAKIINNRGNRVWLGNIQAGHQFPNFNHDTPGTEFFSIRVAGGLNYNWIPNSRTYLSLHNTLQWDYMIFYRASTSHARAYRLSSFFNVDRFMAYNWRVRLVAGISGALNIGENNVSELGVRPRVILSSSYLLF